ncbi:altronate dehydratase large subunit [Natrinema salaciae]|uniref:Altronate dehydratase large subunit n=1 Tax=Natrinema salaciae TaxID=1186196 RepID=A0A1H9NVD7_9EURY|nr:UxaA family hydrolase [Natrinema salaciae]SER39747.1 altronate dehydratase large subunit [Natrinema salaciae]
MKGVVLDDAAVLLADGDTVVTAITDLETGRSITSDDLPGARSAVTLAESIEFGHTVAVTTIEAGEPVYKYGAVIGHASERIEPGEWVHTHNCESNRGRGDLGEDGVTRDGDADVTSSGTFAAFERERGGVGARNRVLVVPSVICSHTVADRIASEVPAAVSTPHDHGCGQLGSDSEQTERTLVGVATNPNVAGALAVGLGCETVQSDGLAKSIADRGVPVAAVEIQRAGGTDACRRVGIDRATDLLERTDATRTTVGLDAATIGVVSSDLRPSTLETADPLVGRVVERIVDAGGRALIAGNERIDAHADALRERAATGDARDRLDAVANRATDSPTAVTETQLRAAEATVSEVSRSWGDLPVRDVLEYGRRPTHDTGVALVDAPSAFDEAATALAAAGAQVVIHVTADGIPAGHPIVPVLKITGDRDTYDALRDDIDAFAGATTCDELLETVRSVLDGEPTCAERHGVTSFAITRVGPSI